MQASNLTVLEAQELARLGMEDPGFFCRTFLPEWFPLQMPWVHRGVLAILSRQVDWLLKFGEETWPSEKSIWDQEQLENILRYFVWRPEPEDLASPLIPLFEAERDSKGVIAKLHLSVSDRTLIIMPRGISKTTLLNANELREINYHETEFLVYLSETATHADQQLENVKRQLETNALLQLVFGLKKPDRAASERWTLGLIETTDGVVVAAKGRGGQVRGMNHFGRRPSKIVCDDVEDAESVKNDEQRKKTRTWLKSDVEPALPQIAGKKRGSIVMLGTVLHHDSLLMSLSRDPEWVTIRFGAVGPGGSTVEPTDEDMLWTHYMNAAAYRAKRRSYQRIGQLSEFNMEYLSSIKSEDDGSKFKPDYLRYEALNRDVFPGVALVMDPAISDKKGSDYCAFGVVGMSPKGQIHVFDCYMERGMTPREQVDKYFELHFAWNCTKHGIEAIGYQQALIHLMREEMFRRGKTMGNKAYFEIESIKHGKLGKVPRVEGILAPRYASGYITHQKRIPLLEEQLLDWPNGKKDGPDVIAMAVSLLDPLAAFAFDPENPDEDKLAKDQYESLDQQINWGAP